MSVVTGCHACTRTAQWVIGAEHAAWPACPLHAYPMVKTARRWRRSGLNGPTIYVMPLDLLEYGPTRGPSLVTRALRLVAG